MIGGTLVRTSAIYTVVPAVIDAFLSEMRRLEKPYSLLNHSCQHMSMEIIDYFTKASRPHWWTDEVTKKILHLQMVSGIDFDGIFSSIGFGPYVDVFFLASNAEAFELANPNMKAILGGNRKSIRDKKHMTRSEKAMSHVSVNINPWIVKYQSVFATWISVLGS